VLVLLGVRAVLSLLLVLLVMQCDSRIMGLHVVEAVVDDVDSWFFCEEL
jgi:hypothetical protein